MQTSDNMSTAHDVHFDDTLAATRRRSNHYFSFTTWPMAVSTPRTRSAMMLLLGGGRHLGSTLHVRPGTDGTHRCSDPDSPAIQALREELVCPGIAPVSVPMLLDVDETDPMNRPFSALEFSAVLESCNVRSASGLDGIGYGVLRGMSEQARGFVLDRKSVV